MRILSFDYLVLTKKSISDTVHFYTRVLGMYEEEFTGNGVTHIALRLGVQKINLHEIGKEFLPDLCRGSLVSDYVRDPDLNLIETSNQQLK